MYKVWKVSKGTSRWLKTYATKVSNIQTSKFLKGNFLGDIRRPSILSPPIILILPSLPPIINPMNTLDNKKPYMWHNHAHDLNLQSTHPKSNTSIDIVGPCEPFHNNQANHIKEEWNKCLKRKHCCFLFDQSSYFVTKIHFSTFTSHKQTQEVCFYQEKIEKKGILKKNSPIHSPLLAYPSHFLLKISLSLPSIQELRKKNKKTKEELTMFRLPRVSEWDQTPKPKPYKGRHSEQRFPGPGPTRSWNHSANHATPHNKIQKFSKQRE